MQAESGQPLELILQRKELERRAGDGLFFWGIGNALGSKVGDLVRRQGNAEVAFSVMKSRPKTVDSAPDAVFVWRSYLGDGHIPQPLPPHVLLLSRATTANGVKDQHYALVCYSDEPLGTNGGFDLPIGHFRNLGSQNPRIGASQVTSIIEHSPADVPEPRYSIFMTAKLREPHFVRLSDPALVPSELLLEIESLSCSGVSDQRWSEMVSHLRSEAEEVSVASGLDLFT